MRKSGERLIASAREALKAVQCDHEWTHLDGRKKRCKLCHVTMIKVAATPTDHAPALAEALRECARELAEHVEDRYKGAKDSRQYERDIGPVQRAREALRQYEGE